MALSPAQNHRLKVLARLTIEAAASGPTAAERPDEGPEANAYSLLRAQMGEHMRQLSDIKSTELKIAAKHTMLADYDDHINTVLLTAMETGKAVQDEVFVRLMIWHFDCGLYECALDMAEHVLTFGLTLPEQFRRNPAELIAELVAEAALAAHSLKADFDITVLQRTQTLITGHDIVDIVSAKLHKAYGLLYLRLAESDTSSPDGPAGGLQAALDAALTHLNRALELEKNIGVKEAIRTVERLLKKDTT